MGQLIIVLFYKSFRFCSSCKTPPAITPHLRHTSLGSETMSRIHCSKMYPHTFMLTQKSLVCFPGQYKIDSEGYSSLCIMEEANTKGRDRKQVPDDIIVILWTASQYMHWTCQRYRVGTSIKLLYLPPNIIGIIQPFHAATNFTHFQANRSNKSRKTSRISYVQG